MRIIRADIDYEQFAGKLYDTCIFTDAWIDGRERFLPGALILDESEHDRISAAAERIGELFDEAVEIVNRNPELLDLYFSMTEYGKLMFEQSAGNWHGVARLDLFFLEDGRLQMCEMNSDTPSGEPETVALNDLCQSMFPEYANPNAGFENSFVGSALRHHSLTLGRDISKDLTVGRAHV